MTAENYEREIGDEADAPGRERLFGALFDIAGKYGFNLTNNEPDPANGKYHIADFCCDVLEAVKFAGYAEPDEVA